MARKAKETKTEVEKPKENIQSFESLKEEWNIEVEKKTKELENRLSDKIDEMIEFKVDKRMKEEEKKLAKRQSFKILRLNLIILVLLVIICYFGYCLFKVDYFNIRGLVKETVKNPVDNSIDREENSPKDDETDTEKNEEEKEKEKREKEQKEKMLKEYSFLVDNLQIEDESLSNFYDGKTTRTMLTNEFKLRVAFKNLEKSDIILEEGIMSIAPEALKKAAKKIFGEEEKLYDMSFNYDNKRFLFYNGAYIRFTDESEKEELKTKFLHKTIDVDLEEKDKLKFTVLFAQVSTDDKLTTAEGTLITEDYREGSWLDYEDDIPAYIFTFEKNDENYIFQSVEPKIDEKIY